MPRVLLMRHGRTYFNAEGRFQGRLDTCLDESGELAAKQLAEFLCANLQGAQIKAFSSPLKRALDTLKPALKALNCQNLELIPELCEIDHGEWNGKLASEVDRSLLQQWRTQPHTCTAGVNAESLLQVQERAFASFGRICKSLTNNEVGLIMAHDAVIRCILLGILNAPLSSFNAIQQHNCAVNVIDCDFSNELNPFTLIHCNLSAHAGFALLSNFYQAAL